MSFLTHFSQLEDPRTHINKEHDLLDILFLTVSAILSGAEKRGLFILHQK